MKTPLLFRERKISREDDFRTGFNYRRWFKINPNDFRRGKKTVGTYCRYLVSILGYYWYYLGIVGIWIFYSGSWVFLSKIVGYLIG